MTPSERAAIAANLIGLNPAEALDLSRLAEAAGYLPVKAKRVRKVWGVLPVYYEGDAFRPRRREPVHRSRAWGAKP